jgi:hypothetical protein
MSKGEVVRQFLAWLAEHKDGPYFLSETGYLETYNDAYVISERVDDEDVEKLVAEFACEDDE